MFKKTRMTTRMPGWSAPTLNDVSGGLITGQSGFVAGTRVASNLGWRDVDMLSVGDSALTFDRGMQVVRDIQRDVLFRRGSLLPRAQRPILLPEGALHNSRDMWLMPDQGMLVESDTASEILGDPFVVVPARALIGFRGIRAAKPDDELTIITLAFDADEAIYVEGGLLAICPRPQDILIDPTLAGLSEYKLLPMKAARHLVRCLIDEDDTAALLCNPDEISHIAAAPADVRDPIST